MQWNRGMNSLNDKHLERPAHAGDGFAAIFSAHY